MKAPPFVFNDIWNRWPNKKDKLSSQKAFEFGLSQDWFSIEELKQCIELFIERESEFTKDNKVLGNWIRNNEYYTYLSLVKSEGLVEAKEELSKLKQEAIGVCETWNSLRMPWWQEVVDIDGRARLVQESLKDKFFRDNWRDGIYLLRKLFRKRRLENDYLSNLIPSIQWFANREHNVLAKILEGEYGRAESSKVFTPKFSKDDATGLDKHGEDILNLTILAMKEREFAQDVVIFDGEEEVTAPWYVMQTKSGLSLKYKGRHIERLNIELYQDGVLTDRARNAIRDLKEKAKRFNESRYSPDIEKQTKVQQENGELESGCPF